MFQPGEVVYYQRVKRERGLPPRRELVQFERLHEEEGYAIVRTKRGTGFSDVKRLPTKFLRKR